MSGTHWGTIAAVSTSSIAAVVGIATFATVRWHNKGAGWSAQTEFHPEIRDAMPRKHIVVTRTRGPAARNVKATTDRHGGPGSLLFGPGGDGDDAVPVLNPGGRLDYSLHVGLNVSVRLVIVEWDGWFGWRRKWHSGL